MDQGIACPNSTYQDQTGQQSCLICPAGSACPSADGPPQPCNNGTYSILGDAYCQTCPGGYRWVYSLFASCTVRNSGTIAVAPVLVSIMMEVLAVLEVL